MMQKNFWTLCLSATLCVCRPHCVSVGHTMCLSATLCVCRPHYVSVGQRSAEGWKPYKYPFNSARAVAWSPGLSERVLGESLQFLGSSWGHLEPGGWGRKQKQQGRARNMRTFSEWNTLTPSTPTSIGYDTISFPSNFVQNFLGMDFFVS